MFLSSISPGAAGNEPNPVVGRLVAALRSNDDKVGAAAAAALGLTGDPQAVEPLITDLEVVEGTEGITCRFSAK